jgi:VanZ family protein
MNWAAVLLWAGTIFYASSLSDLGLNTKTSLLPILGHVLEYAVLTVLLIRALGSKRPTVRRTVWIAALLALAYAGSDEYHQSFVPNRHPSALDILVDAAAIGAVGIVTVKREQA